MKIINTVHPTYECLGHEFRDAVEVFIDLESLGGIGRQDFGCQELTALEFGNQGFQRELDDSLKLGCEAIFLLQPLQGRCSFGLPPASHLVQFMSLLRDPKFSSF